MSEEAITVSVRPLALLVEGPINFHVEADLGAREVHDAWTDDELPTEREAGLGAG